MKKKSILFFTKYGDMAASSRLRAYQYRKMLSDEGYECEVSPLLDNDYLLHRADYKIFNLGKLVYLFMVRFFKLFLISKHDIIVIHMELFPYIPPVFEWFLFKTNKQIYHDYDDAIFCNYDNSDNFFIRIALKGKISYLMRNSTATICCNKYIEKYALMAGSKKTIMLPTPINIHDYDLSKYNYEYKDRDLLTIGWIGSWSTTKYLSIIAEALVEVNAITPVELYIVGADIDFDIEGISVVRKQWSLESEQKALANFDIGVMPLEHTQWEEGKCGFKLIQYMAAGLPVIATGVGINSEIVLNNKNGFIANSKEEWIKYILMLYNDKSLCDSMGKLGRKMVEQSFTIQVAFPQFIELIVNNSE